MNAPGFSSTFARATDFAWSARIKTVGNALRGVPRIARGIVFSKDLTNGSVQRRTERRNARCSSGLSRKNVARIFLKG